MSMPKDERAPEIVIVRRKRGGGGDCHHGGVWKVAYADFMTAMMAFFLVMWLINAANEATRSQVASYFNPVKLVDSSTNPRGIKETSRGSSGDVENKELKSEAKAKTEEAPEAKSGKEKDEEGGKEGPVSHFSGGDIPESELFRDPRRALDKIAGGAPDMLKGASRTPRRNDTLGAKGGEEFRDPFSPRSWETIAKDLPPDETSGGAEGGPETHAGTGGEADMKAPGKPDRTKRAPMPPAAGKASGPSSGKKTGAKSLKGKAARKTQAEKTAAAKARESAAAKSEKAKKGPGGKDSEQAAKEAAKKKAFEKLKKAIVAQMKGGDKKHLPGVSVRRTPEGILISLTDKAGFGMFDIASAKPRRETVRFMEKIAGVIARAPGEIIVRGHTDGRPFRSATYDNWRLSTARAHVARYMLLRGGLPEKRIVRVEGYADTRLAVPGDPLDARNRRIEILIRDR